jgi:hypothetical protein
MFDAAIDRLKDSLPLRLGDVGHPRRSGNQAAKHNTPQAAQPFPD